MTERDPRKLLRLVESKQRLEQQGLVGAPAPPADLTKIDPGQRLSRTDRSLVTPELPTDWLPAPVRDWCEAVAHVYRVPRTLPIAAAMTAAASVLQGRVRVRVAPGWEEPLSLWWLVFSSSGTHKSSILNKARRPIEYWQTEMEAQLEPKARRARNRSKRLDAQIAAMRRANAIPSETEDGYSKTRAHERRLAELESERDSIEVPVSEYLLHQDINPSLIPRLMERNRRASGVERLAVLNAEGQFLRNLLGRYQGSPNLELALAASSGEPMSWVRSAETEDGYRHIRLMAPHLTMGLLLQPSLLELVRSTPMLSDVGFVGRCVIDVLDDNPRKPRLGEAIPDEVQGAYDEWLLGLCTLWVSDDGADIAQGAQPSVIDLWSDQSNRRQIVAAYDSVEAGGSAWNKRAIGIVARMFAIVAIGAGTGGEDARPYEYERLFLLIYTQKTNNYERLDQPSGLTDSLACRVGVTSLRLAAMATMGTSSGNHSLKCGANTGDKRKLGVDNSNSVAVRDLARYLNRPRVKSDDLYAALEELEDQGVIEWDAASERVYRRVRRYRAFRIVNVPQWLSEAARDSGEEVGPG